MTTHLDVLVVENRRHAADRAIAALDAAGHDVHRCYDPDSRGFPCRAILEPGGCPIDQGIDVTLAVRDRIEPRPTRFETGISCAIRAGVPTVELGPAPLDPFGPWLTHRIAEDENLVEGVTLAARQGLDHLRQAILARIRTVVPDPAAIDCSVERNGRRLTVGLSGPAVGDRAETALAVRVLDAVRHSGRTYEQVDVLYHQHDGAAAETSG